MRKELKIAEKTWGEIYAREKQILEILSQPTTIEESKEALRLHLNKVLRASRVNREKHLVGKYADPTFEPNHPDRKLAGSGYAGVIPTEDGILPNVLVDRPWNSAYHLSVFPLHWMVTLGIILDAMAFAVEKIGERKKDAILVELAKTLPETFFTDLFEKVPASAFGKMSLAEKKKKVSRLKAEVEEREVLLKKQLRKILEDLFFKAKKGDEVLLERIELLFTKIMRGERKKDRGFQVLKKRFDAIAVLVKAGGKEDEEADSPQTLRERLM